MTTYLNQGWEVTGYTAVTPTHYAQAYRSGPDWKAYVTRLQDGPHGHAVNETAEVYETAGDAMDAAGAVIFSAIWHETRHSHKQGAGELATVWLNPLTDRWTGHIVVAEADAYPVTSLGEEFPTAEQAMAAAESWLAHV